MFFAVSNILVQQNCKCVSPLQCECAGDGGVQYVLGDLNLMCMEDDQSGKGGEWEKMLQHAPAGTIGKIAPEVINDISYKLPIPVYIHSYFLKPIEENVLGVTNQMYIQLV